MKDPSPPDYTKVPEHNPNEVRRTVSLAADKARRRRTTVCYVGGKLGRPVALGFIEMPVAEVRVTLRMRATNLERFGCLAKLGVAWRHDESLAKDLLCDAETFWQVA